MTDERYQILKAQLFELAQLYPLDKRHFSYSMSNDRNSDFALQPYQGPKNQAAYKAFAVWVARVRLHGSEVRYWEKVDGL